MQVWTTLKNLKKAGACADRYGHLRKALGSRYGISKPIDICRILETNGMNDVLWIPEIALTGTCLDKRYRLFAVACCHDIWHLLMDSRRSKNAVMAAHLFGHGEIGECELATARDAARAAARAAAWAAAWDTAWDAARDAAWDAARARQSEHFRVIFSADF